MARYEKWMREHIQFSARVPYQNIPLAAAECISSSAHIQMFAGPAQAPPNQTVPLWSFSSFPKDTGEPDISLHLP